MDPETTPLAVGFSWRPPRGLHARVTIHPLPREFKLASGKTSIPYGGEVYLRYSPDLVHWSSWQALQHVEPQSREEKQNPGRHFSAMIRVPSCDSEEYDALLREYAQLDVPWKSDEEAACRWILEQQPDFFARHIPFIGYVQFRFEGSFYGGQRITSLKAAISYGMSGLHSAPGDPEVYKSRDNIPWRFKGDEAADQVSADTPPDTPKTEDAGESDE